MTKKEVLNIMGEGTHRTREKFIVTNPFRRETYVRGERVYDVLFYFTDTKDDDKAITDDELTPIVIKENRLYGWGWENWKRVIQDKELTVKSD